MKFLLTINGKEYTLETEPRPSRQERFAGLLDGAAFDAQITAVQPGVYSILLGGKQFQVRITPAPPGASNSHASGSHYTVQIDGVAYEVLVNDRRRRGHDRVGIALEGKQDIRAPMPGKVIRILVSENQRVETGQGLVVVEAMKMQNEIKCPQPGSVQKVLVQEGQTVNAGEVLMLVE